MRRRTPITLVRYLGHRAWWVGVIQAAVVVAGALVLGLVFAGLLAEARALAGAL